jgi:phosphoenolpyruvate carboxykinase (ATP)
MDRQGTAGHPRNIVFLAADAFGVLPPIARLSRAQAMYHYLSGYTAKVAGTEMGVTEPTATFSACFGAAFLPLHPGQYAELFGELLDRHKPGTWLINTGWIGGPYGVGKRISLAWTRRIVRAALSGELNSVPMATDPIFGFEIPTVIDGVPSEILQPRQSWTDAAAYDKKAKELAAMFRENFEKYASGVSDEVRAAAPRG